MTESATLHHASGFAGTYISSPHAIGAVIEDVWPPLFWDSAQLDEVRRKAETLPWARALVDTLALEADRAVRAEPLLPIEPIGWRHDFYSPATGAHLVYDPASPFEHVDPYDQSVWCGESFHKAWTLLTHERTYRMMRSVGLLFALTGERRYAEWVVRGMELAVEMYSHDELREGNRDNALYFVTLYDAQMLAYLANIYDLTKDSAPYTPELRRAVRATIFEKSMPGPIGFQEEPSLANMTCYCDAAMAFAGRALGRDDWTERGIHHAGGGFYALLRNEMATDQDGQFDGFWGEGTQFYHFYSLCPLLSLLPLVEAAPQEDAPMPLDEVRRRLGRMLAAPAEMADQRLRLPAIGDLGSPKSFSLRNFRHVYEAGAGLLGDDEAAATLAAIYTDNTPRNGLAALLFGPDEISAPPRRTRSVHLPAAGIVFLRQEDFEASLRADDARVRSHAHHDRLNVTLTAFGEQVLADLGTSGYARKDYCAYCRSRFSHNVVLIDELTDRWPDHPPITESGPKASTDANRAEAWITDSDGPARIGRRIRLAPPLLLMEDRCEADHPHRFTWLLHPYGSLSVACCGKAAQVDIPPLPEDGPLAFFTHRRRFAAGSPICLDWRITERLWLRAWICVSQPFEYVLGRTPGNPIPEGRSTVAVRLVSDGWCIRSALEVHRGHPELAAFPEEHFPLEGV